MKKLSRIAIFAVLPIFVMAGGVHAQLTASEPVAARDNIEPAAVGNLQAADTPGKVGKSVTLTWSLSKDDARSFSAFGGRVVSRGGVLGYRIYRRAGQSSEELIATVQAGVSTYVDEDVRAGTAYVYSVRPFDQDNETSLDVVDGSAEDQARAIVAGFGSGVVPLDSEGNPILGWFSRGGNRVTFNDFFLFAEQLGRQEGDKDYNALYDIDPNGIIDFEDFFRFAEDFNKFVINADEVRANEDM